jgi:DNA-binding transcriptional regulator YiaG
MISAYDIKKARIRLGESQHAFSKRFGVDQSTVHRWETRGLPEGGTSRLIVARMLAELKVLQEQNG